MNNLDKIKQESEREFDEEFPAVHIFEPAGHFDDGTETANKVKSFLLSKLDLAYNAGQEENTKLHTETANEARQAERKEMVERIRQLAKNHAPIDGLCKAEDCELCVGYESALRDVLKLLKE